MTKTELSIEIIHNARLHIAGREFIKFEGVERISNNDNCIEILLHNGNQHNIYGRNIILIEDIIFDDSGLEDESKEV